MHQNSTTYERLLKLLALPLAALVAGSFVFAALEVSAPGYLTYVTSLALITIAIATRNRWLPRVVAFGVARAPTKHQARLWLRDHWKQFLAVIPLGLAGFLAWHFWPLGIGLAGLVLFATTISTISWRRVRQGYGGMEFPHQTVLRAEGHHPLAFLVFGWEWGALPKWKAPERGEEHWVQWALGASCGLLWRVVRNSRLWPVILAAIVGTAAYVGGLEVFINPDWWYILVWFAGLIVATNYWWRFAIFVWPAYRVVLTDETVIVVYPVRGVLGTIDIAAPEIPLTKIGHWQTTLRALGGGDWDPAFVFGRENVILRWLRDPEGFKQAAREQLERLEALAWAQRR